MALTKVTSGTLSANAVAAAHIADGTVVAAEIADDAITTAKILNANVTTAKIAADAVDGTKIADDALNSEHYAAASIDNEHLADDAVGVAELSATGTASSSTFLRGDNAWAAAGGGKILQGPIIERFTERVQLFNTSLAVVDDDWAVTITPSATSSKILVQVLCHNLFGDYNVNHGCLWTLYRNGTDIAPTASQGLFFKAKPLVSYGWFTTFFQTVDAPNSTSALTYKPYFSQEGGNTRFGLDNNTTANQSMMWAWEIGA